MNKCCVALLIAVLSFFKVSAAYEPYSQWMIFAGNYAFLDNKITKKINFSGGQDVTAMVEQANGNHVFGVAGVGLFIYDGKKMEQLKTPSDCFANYSDIISLATDSKNTLWIGTAQGLVKYEGGNFVNIPATETKLQVITDIAITATDKVYVSGMVMGEKGYVGGGLSFFNGSNWTSFNKGNSEIPDNLLSDLLVDNTGHLWAIPGAKQDMGVAKFDGKNWKYFTTAAGLPVNQINAIATNSTGKVWLGTPKGIIENDGATFTMKPFSNSFTPLLADAISRMNGANLDVTSLAVEENGTIWVGTKNSGTFSFRNGGLKILTPANSPILSNATLKISIDKNGYKWMVAGYKYEEYATRAPFDKNRNHTPYLVNTGGVTVYRENAMITNPKWIVYDSTTCPYDLGSTFTIDEDKQGNIWFTGNGLMKYKDGAFSNFKHPQAMKNGFSILYIAPDGKIFLPSSVSGLKVFENGTISDYSKGLGMGGISTLTYDKNNVLWAAGQGGIARWVNNEWETFKKSDGLPANIIYSLFKDSKDSLWAGTMRGLVKWDSTWKRVGEDVDFPSDDFTCIAEDKNGRLLLGCNKGISIYDHKTFTNIPKVESLNLNKFRVNQICVDKNSIAWIATEAYGVLRFDGTNWTQLNSKTTGALWDRITAVKMASDGKLYISSSQSMSNTFDPELPTQDADELLRRDITRRIKLADPRQLFAVIQM